MLSVPRGSNIVDILKLFARPWKTLREQLNRRCHPRAVMARCHLRGEGIEIGAMHFPVWPHRGMKVKYVDNTSLEDNLLRFPELRGINLVRPNYVEDGFSLASLGDGSQDFVIANHVLEHAPNPLGVLCNWARVLRPGGSMLLSVPIAEACFDRGRQETSLEHMQGDYRADTQELGRRNLEHYLEWLAISEPAILAMNGQQPKAETAAERRERAEEICRANSEIHFHTFSAASFHRLLEFFATSLDGRFRVVEIREAGGEIIAVISRQS